MEELRPFTISKSILNEPTVLLTEDDKRYTLWCPITDNVRIIHYIRTFMLNHFQVRVFDTAKFTLRGTNYLCYEEEEGSVELDSWQSYLWEDKRKFNQFLKPRTLFEIMIFEQMFPLFGGVNTKFIIPNKKNRFSFHPIPANNYSDFKFSPITIAQQEMNSASFKRFFQFQKQQLEVVIEEVFALNDEKFQQSVKHHLSLFPARRNELWDQLSKCFDPNFITYTKATFYEYLLHL